MNDRQITIDKATYDALIDAVQLVLDFHGTMTTERFLAKYGDSMGMKAMCNRLRMALAKARGEEAPDAPQ